MKFVFKWIGAGLLFSLGFSIVIYFAQSFLNQEETKLEYFQSELKGKLEIIEINPTESEDRLAFNALIKNLSNYQFGYTWVRVELYDNESKFIDSCDATTSNFEPNSQRWIQIKCGLPGYNFKPEYQNFEYTIMEAAVERNGT